MRILLMHYLLLAVSILLCGCERKKPELFKALEENSTWSEEFAKLYPEPIPPCEKNPQLGNTGNLGITQNLQFILLDFPAEKLPELTRFVMPKLRAQGLETVTILAFVPAGTSTSPDVVERVTLKYHSDGRIEDSRLTGVHAEIPEPNINGRAIKRSEQDAAEQPATAGDSK